MTKQSQKVRMARLDRVAADLIRTWLAAGVSPEEQFKAVRANFELTDEGFGG